MIKDLAKIMSKNKTIGGLPISAFTQCAFFIARKAIGNPLLICGGNYEHASL